MKLNPEIELLNTISALRNRLFSFHKELKVISQDLDLRFDLSMHSTDRKEWPKSPIGITWEINLDKKGEIFFFELTHESNWSVSAEFARSGPETIEEYFDLEFEELSDFLTHLPNVIAQFEERCLENLRSKNYLQQSV